MPRKQLRRIVLASGTYRWRVTHRHTPPRCTELLSAFLDGHPRAPLRILFTEGDEVGYDYIPRSGFVVDHRTPLVSANLHEPGTVRALIERGLAAGWRPAEQPRPFVVDDGWAMLRIDASSRLR